MVGLINALFPPAPIFTDANITSQTGKAFIVTGAASGIGFEVSKILYAKGGTVYIAARSNQRATEAISKIKAEVPKSMGRLEPMVIDLADLTTIKPAAEDFLKKESRLDLLVHNAGIMEPPAGSKTKLGHDLEMGTHCLGPFVLTTILQDIMRQTAALSPSEPYSVRIVWVTSLMQLGVPAGGIQFDEKGTPKVLKAMANYMESKVGGSWLANDFARRLDKNGIMSVSVVFKPAIYGAYTELFAAFSPSLKAEDNGGYVMAWGRLVDLPEDVAKGMKSQEAGGNGGAERFWSYCERETKDYM